MDSTSLPTSVDPSARGLVCYAAGGVFSFLTPEFERLLADQSVTLQALTDLPASPLSPANAIRSAIETSDFVLGVLSFDPSSANVLFELGVATALGKPVLLVVVGDTPVPFDLADFVVVRIFGSDFQPLLLAIEQLRNAIAKGEAQAPQTRKAPRGRPLANRVDELLRLVTEGATEQQIVNTLVEALIASGVHARRGTPSAAGFDFAVWADDLESFMGNPILVEVKTRVSTHARLRDAILQTSRDLAFRPGRWALLLYTTDADDGEPVLSSDLPYPVLSSRLDRFAERLRDTSFADAVRLLRNERVHSGPRAM